MAGSPQVIRRVGGLEVPMSSSSMLWTVIRRVGGLEGPLVAYYRKYAVIRRVGGLEDHRAE